MWQLTRADAHHILIQLYTCLNRLRITNTLRSDDRSHENTDSILQWKVGELQPQPTKKQKSVYHTYDYIFNSYSKWSYIYILAFNLVVGSPSITEVIEYGQ